MQRRHQVQRADGGSRSTPSNRVARCHTFAVGSSTGSASKERSSQNPSEHRGHRRDDDRVLLTLLRRSASALALARSSSGSPDRGAVPASGMERTRSPRRDSSSSGLAPTSSPLRRRRREGEAVRLHRPQAMQQPARVERAAPRRPAACARAPPCRARLPTSARTAAPHGRGVHLGGRLLRELHRAERLVRQVARPRARVRNGGGFRLVVAARRAARSRRRRLALTARRGIHVEAGSGRTATRRPRAARRRPARRRARSAPGRGARASGPHPRRRRTDLDAVRRATPQPPRGRGAR